MSISENYNYICNNIKQILERCERPNEEVTIIAVSKTVDVDKVHELDETSCRDIGENKPQELVRKFDDVKDRYRCHMIGHLQTNKVKDVIDKAVLIHGLDRPSLIKEIEKRAKKDGKPVECLIQLNIGEEEQKSGIYLEDLEDLIDQIENCNYLKVKGLMTIAPFAEDPEEIRWVFRKMKNVFDELKAREFSNIEMKYLSMGMTNDYQIAVEEGANMVRIGTAIFGERNYN